MSAVEVPAEVRIHGDVIRAVVGDQWAVEHFLMKRGYGDNTEEWWETHVRPAGIRSMSELDDE